MMTQVETVARIAGQNGKPERLICRLDDGTYVLAEAAPDVGAGAVRRITPAVGMDDIVRCATGVLAGDAKARTWPHALDVLALGWALVFLKGAANAGTAEDVPAAEAPTRAPSDGRNLSAAGAAPMAAADPPLMVESAAASAPGVPRG